MKRKRNNLVYRFHRDQRNRRLLDRQHLNFKDQIRVRHDTPIWKATGTTTERKYVSHRLLRLLGWATYYA